MENERSLNHGLDIGAAVVVASWQELIVGLYVMQRHGVLSKAYMGRNVGPLLYLTKLDVKYDHLWMENERSLNHGLDIGAAVEVGSGWQELIVGLYVMQRHGVSSKAYMGRNVGPLLYLTKLDVKYHHLWMENERSLNHGLDIGAALGVAGWQELIVGLYVMQRKAWSIIQGIHGT